ncbi:MAG: phosphatase PAP2 family protein [Bryobacteraceae bacterium]
MVPRKRLAQIEWWPIDRLVGGYLVLFALVIWMFRTRLPDAPWLLAAHAAGLLLIAAAALSDSRAASVFRHWYPLPYVSACYKEMALLIPAVRGVDYDAQLAALDYRLWGVHPTVWLERLESRWLTEILQAGYSLFVPAVLLVAFLLWRRGRCQEFRQYAFLIALGFLVSYVGYLLAPARGPRFLLADLQRTRLEGLWAFEWLQRTLDQLESAHYDCFPSGHTELTILACWGARGISHRLHYAYVAYTLSIFFATVYLRYHYTVDVAAGIVVAAGLIAAAPSLYKLLGAKDWESWKLFRFMAGRN